MTDQAAAGEGTPVEALRGVLEGLLAEREQLHAAAAGRDALERNRQAIVRAQWELSRALIARHHRLEPA